MGTFLGVPIRRTIVFRGLYWGPLILGNYHFAVHLFLHGSSEACRAPDSWKYAAMQVTMLPNADHGFIQFQSAALATWIIAKFNETAARLGLS